MATLYLTATGILKHELKPIAGLNIDEGGIISGVRDHSAAFLQYLEKRQLIIGKKIKVKEVIDYDHSMILQMDSSSIHISREVAKNLLIAL
jgi:DtxR family Mn-dependent transcriptional regulator